MENIPKGRTFEISVHSNDQIPVKMVNTMDEVFDLICNTRDYDKGSVVMYHSGHMADIVSVDFIKKFYTKDSGLISLYQIPEHKE